MKKYLSGLVAVVLAIVTVAFVNKPKMIDGKEVAPNADPCSSQNKRWFIINLECNDQSLSGIRNPANYSPSSFQEVAELCQGSECVCAIYACPTTNGQYPIINSSTTIYTALADYWMFGTPSAYIMEKNQIWARK